MFWSDNSSKKQDSLRFFFSYEKQERTIDTKVNFHIHERILNIACRCGCSSLRSLFVYIHKRFVHHFRRVQQMSSIHSRKISRAFRKKTCHSHSMKNFAQL